MNFFIYVNRMAVVILTLMILSLVCYSQNLKDYDPHLYEMIKNNENRIEIEKYFKDKKAQKRESFNKTNRSVSEADPYFGWEGHNGGQVYSVSFSPDGKIIASGGIDFTVRLWRVIDGSLIKTLIGHNDFIDFIDFTRDGEKLITKSLNEIMIWDALDGSLLKTLFFESDYLMSSVDISPDGTKLAIGTIDATIKIWDVLNGIPVDTLVENEGSEYNVTFSPDGTKLVSSSYDVIKIWDIANNSIIKSIVDSTNYINSIIFSPDGTKLVSGGYDKIVKLWNLSDGSLLKTLVGHTDFITSLCFSSDGTKLASSSNNEINIWNVSDGLLLTTKAGNSTAIAIAPDGTKLADCNSDGIKILSTLDWLPVRTIIGHSTEVHSIAFSPDGAMLASGGEDGTIKIWNKEDGSFLRSLKGHSGNVVSLAFSSDGLTLVSSCFDSTIRIWDVSDGSLKHSFKENLDVVESVAFSPDGTMLASGSGSKGKTIKIWNVSDGRIIRTFSGHTSSIGSVVFSPDGKKLASGSYRELKIWDVSNGSILKTYSDFPGRIYSVAFSPDGKKLASGGYKEVRLWNVSDYSLIKTFSGYSGSVYSVVFSPDGTKLTYGSQDGTIKIWKLKDYSLSRTIVFDSGFPHSICYNSDGTALASGGRGYNNIRIYNVESTPSTIAKTASSIKMTSAILNGNVNANRAAASVSFEYGITDSYGENINATPCQITGTSYVSTAAKITGLKPNTKYHYRIKAENSEGITYGSDVTFTTKENEPLITLDSALNITTSSVLLKALVNPNGESVVVMFEYGVTENNWSVMSSTPSNITGTTNTSVSANISGLLPNTVYHYRGKITCSSGTFYSEEKQFITSGYRLCGDANSDSLLNAFDASLVLKHVTGMQTLKSQGLINADVNLDNEVSAYDAALILRKITGLLMPAGVTNNCWGGSLLKSSVVIQIPVLVISPGDFSEKTNFINLKIQGVKAENEILALSFNIKSENINDVTVGGLSDKYIFISNKINEGLYKLAIINPEGINTDDINIGLKLNNSSYSISITDMKLNDQTQQDINISETNSGENGITSDYNLIGAYPNPFNPSTKVVFEMKTARDVAIDIYSITGAKVKTLLNDKVSEGRHEVIWDAKDSNNRAVSTGTYICVMKAGDFMKSMKINFMK